MVGLSSSREDTDGVTRTAMMHTESALQPDGLADNTDAYWDLISLIRLQPRHAVRRNQPIFCPCNRLI